MIVAWNFYKAHGCTKDVSQAKEMLTQLAIAGNDKAKEILKFVIRN
jgi:TPR repeat protein